MGWGSGSELAGNIWEVIKPNLKPGSETEVAKCIVQEFRNMDCDTLQEVPDLIATAFPDGEDDEE